MLFLREMRLSVREVENYKFKLGFLNCLTVSAIGRKGGIALFWERDVVYLLLIILLIILMLL